MFYNTASRLSGKVSLSNLMDFGCIGSGEVENIKDRQSECYEHTVNAVVYPGFSKGGGIKYWMLVVFKNTSPKPKGGRWSKIVLLHKTFFCVCFVPFLPFSYGLLKTCCF